MSPQPNGGSRVSLRQILDPLELIGAEDVLVARCEIDPRKVRPGDLFVALPSSLGDPYAGAYEAAARGAGAVLADTALPELGVPVAVVPNTVEACAQLAHALAGFPSRTVNVVGLVGGRCARVGAAFLQPILTAGNVVDEASCGSGLPVLRNGSFLWGEDPRAAATWLRSLADVGVSVTVLPIPETAVSTGRLAGFHFCALALGPVCQRWRGNWRREPAERWLGLVDQIDPAGWAVLARQHPLFECVLELLEVPGVTVDLDGPAEVSARVLEESLAGQLVLLRVDEEVHVVRLRMPGREALYGALLATAIALGFGIPLLEIVQSLSRLRPVPGYLRPLRLGREWAAAVDEFSSFEELEETLSTLRRLNRGRLRCVLPGLETLVSTKVGEDLACAIGDRLRLIKLFSLADVVYLTETRERWDFVWRGSGGRALPGLGCPQELERRLVLCPDLESALAEAIRACRAGDILLVALSSSPWEGGAPGRAGELLSAFREPAVGNRSHRAV